jgi:hypothetical protein
MATLDLAGCGLLEALRRSTMGFHLWHNVFPLQHKCAYSASGDVFTTEAQRKQQVFGHGLSRMNKDRINHKVAIRVCP